MAIVQYCSAADVAKLVGSAGVSLRTDDDSGATSDCIDEASVEIDGYLLLQYTQAALVLSEWVKKKARVMAAYYLAGRRLNAVPESLKDRYDAAIKELEAVSGGKRYVPDAPQRKENVPVLSNSRVSLRPHPRVVQQPSRSTGTPEGYPQHQDPTDYDV